MTRQPDFCQCPVFFLDWPNSFLTQSKSWWSVAEQVGDGKAAPPLWLSLNRLGKYLQVTVTITFRLCLIRLCLIVCKMYILCSQFTVWCNSAIQLKSSGSYYQSGIEPEAWLTGFCYVYPHYYILLTPPVQCNISHRDKLLCYTDSFISTKQFFNNG